MLALVSCTLERCTGSRRKCCCSCGAHQSHSMYLDMQQELMIGDAQDVSSSTDLFLQPDSLTSSLQSTRIIPPAHASSKHALQLQWLFHHKPDGNAKVWLFQSRKITIACPSAACMLHCARC